MDEKIKEIEKRVELKYFCNPMNFQTVENDFKTLLSHVKQLEDSMIRHFHDEHIMGDGREIDRWKRKVKGLEELVGDLGPQVENMGASKIDDMKCIEELKTHIKELEERIESAEATRDDALAYAKMHKDKVKELEREKNIFKDERDELRGLHDAGIREAYRICGVEDDGEYRWKWVLLELSTLVSRVKELEERWKRWQDSDPKFRDINYLLAVEKNMTKAETRAKYLEEGIEQIEKMGHNDECLMCAMKDTWARKLIEKEKVNPTSSTEDNWWEKEKP